MTRLHKLGAMVIIVTLLLVLLYASCGSVSETPADEPETSGGTDEASGFGEYGVAYFGLISMEELAIRSSAIARVRFRSVEQVVETVRTVYPGGNQSDHYVGALVVTFNVLEYLKGSGGQQIEVVLHDGDITRWTEAEIRELDEDLLEFRDKRWDDREAIVFLVSGQLIPSTVSDSDRYIMTYLRANGEHGYTVDSRWAKAWLPDAAPPSTDGQPTGASGDSQRFLTNVPGGSGATGLTGNQTETMTLGEIKAFIKALEDEIAAGDGTEDYPKCVLGKYRWERLTQHDKEWMEADPTRQFAQQFDRQIASGVPAGTAVYVGGNFLILSEASRLNKPAYGDDLVVKTGRDADLFAKGWPLTAITARPLPVGEYRFYWAEQSYIDALCDAMPEDHRTRNEVVVTVTPPPDTLHEAFFDPVTLASGVGADSSNGVLNPAAFSVDGTSTSITGLKWESGSVVLSLSTHASLSGHKLDFIELDGSVSLSLPASYATEDTTAGTLSWSITEQPWHHGEMLMLRISPSNIQPTPVPTPK